jgi:hypothetical protein
MNPYKLLFYICLKYFKLTNPTRPTPSIRMNIVVHFSIIILLNITSILLKSNFYKVAFSNVDYVIAFNIVLCICIFGANYWLFSKPEQQRIIEINYDNKTKLTTKQAGILGITYSLLSLIILPIVTLF